MGMLAATAALAAVGVAWSGYKNSPETGVRPDAGVRAANAPKDRDPLSPRLFDQSGPIRVHVAGAVKNPGVYSLPAWARVVDAMKKAGGPTQGADLDAINLADPVKDGEQVRIPVKGRPMPLRAHLPTTEPPPLSPTAGGHALGRYPFAAPASLSGAGRQAKGAALQGPVNLNTGTRDELDALPGIGPATADRILAYRQEHGPFLQPEDLMNVKGIGPVKFEQLRGLITAP
jgi:competence ComEA-like helix-hairpin-helix protein